jgi:hypothetical protein
MVYPARKTDSTFSGHYLTSKKREETPLSG